MDDQTMNPPERPTSVEELREHESFYQQRVEAWEAETGFVLGSVLFPNDGASEFAVRAYHEAMVELGLVGVEYAQEALHGNGEYFDDFFDSLDDLREDVDRFGDLA